MSAPLQVVAGLFYAPRGFDAALAELRWTVRQNPEFWKNALLYVDSTCERQARPFAKYFGEIVVDRDMPAVVRANPMWNCKGWWAHLADKLALVGTGDDERHFQGRKRLDADRFMQLQTKMRAHARPQHFRRPQRRRAFERNHLLKSKRARAAQNRTHIARILHAVKNHGRKSRIEIVGGRQVQYKSHARW